MSIKFSIITPCYNSEKTIRKTIESVLQQSYSDYEYIIIDGESKDATLDVIHEYEEQFQGKLKVISEKDNGIYDAMNKGIRNATGDFIGIINSDDWYETDTLSNIVEAENSFKNQTGCSTKYRLYYGILRFIEGEKERRCSIYHHEFLKDTMINHPTVFMSRAIYEHYGLYNCLYKAVADFDYMLNLYEDHQVNFIPIYKIQANFRIGGMTNTYTSVVEAMQVKKKHSIISGKKYVFLRLLLWMRKVLGFLPAE